ncbi:hypothetical protein XI09_08330 [Bradyrhizobium sp. CCBAU 11386]|nr:hypothetical protein [Bradyrhizobium sp. CCBAU 11386]
MARVWAGRAVEEGNLHVHVSALRKALDEQGDGHSYVVTVPGRGYRLAGLKEPSSAEPGPLIDQGEARELPRTIERRQLTVLSCELMGAAALAMRLDPEDFSTVMAEFSRYWTDIWSRTTLRGWRTVDRIIPRRLGRSARPAID